MTTKRLQLTLAILKPDVTPMLFSVSDIRQNILDAGFLVVRTSTVRMSRARAEEFYSEHSGKFFYNRLVGFMSSGEAHAHVLAKTNAIQDWRSLLGATKVFKTRYEQPHSIRGRFGLSDTRNCVHGSDSNDSAAKEIGFFFPDFIIDRFYTEEEERYRMGNGVHFDPVAFEHKLSSAK